MFFRSIFISFLIFCLSAPFFPPIAQSEGKTKSNFCRVAVHNRYNKKVYLRAEIARSESARRVGLMFRQSLKKDSGMLFIFPHEQRLNFWMKNTYIPLSIAYISSSGRINEMYNMKPLDTSVTYPSKKPALFALEMEKGWFAKNNIIPGNKVDLSGCFSK